MVVSRIAIAALFAAYLLPAQTIDFQREIRPILSENCFQCHGPDSGSRQADLRLDRRDSALESRAGGTPIVPGKSAESMVYQRISSPDAAFRMPPAEAHKTLTPAQIATVQRWIDAGAPWKEHWAFQAPVKPKPPAVPTSGSAAAWARNPIDRFILAKLEEKGLAPAPAENRRALIRRVALDATGLPPKPAEVESFLQDTSPSAYERMVDRYLDSPHYGEHRARYWLDAARYGDTHGIHIDNYREIWPYRDWVIAAFNRNLRFDQFSIEQLAGDLLPNATLEQRIATGFQRCNVTTNEAGIIDEEYAEIYAKDRADTVGAVWLGMTVGCATCHDHKFDPISQKDFYALGAFFRNTTQKVMDGNISDTPPILLVPRARDRAAWEQKSARIPAIGGEMEQVRDSAAAPFEQWLGERRPEPKAEPLEGAEDAFTADIGQGLQFEKAEGHTIAKVPKADAGKPFSISIRFRYPRKEEKKEQNYTIAGQQNVRDRNRGWVADITSRQVGFRLIGDNGAAIEARAADPGLLQPGTWNHFAATYDGSREQSGLMLYLNGRLVVAQGLGARNARLNGSIESEDGIVLGRSLAGGGISDFRLFHRVLTEAEARLLSGWGDTAAALAQPTADLTPAARRNLLDWFLTRCYEPYRKLAAERHRLNLELRAIASRGAVTLVMEERADQRPFAHVLYRGAYDQKRDRVEAGTPAVLPPMASALPRNRLGFARWLFTEDHPLTARVAVNRMWQEIFGVGLVKTADDFGSQGEPPSDPQLLDWLAVDFRESGWDVKRFYRQVLTSAAYRQMALTTPEKLAKDPENRQLSRGPRFRMDAEMLRDYALAASGLLAPQTGGPSVKPYQPEGIWEAVAMDGSNTRFYKPDTGSGLYRRSLYTFWKRSAPPASMDVFNAPTRESCVVRRERTNTPLQALAAMNDVQLVEAARVLAESAMENTIGFDARLDYITARVLARPLGANERQMARRAYSDFERYYNVHGEDARKFLDEGERKPDPSLAPGEHAALTMLASQLLNLDEVLNK